MPRRRASRGSSQRPARRGERHRASTPSASRRATPTPPRSPSSPTTTSRPSTTSTSPRARSRPSSRCSGPRATSGSRDSADRLLPDLLHPARSRRLRRRRRRRGAPRPARLPPARASDLARLPGRDRGRAARRPGRDPGAARRRADPRELPRRRLTAFPLGAVIATAALVALAPLAFLDDRADLDLLDPEPAALDHLRDRGRVPRLPRRLARPGGTGELAARLARPRRGASRGAPLDRRDQGDRRSGAGRLRGQRHAAASRSRYLADVALLILATNLFNLLDLRPGRAEKALALLGAGLCLGAWTIEPIELLGIFVGPDPGRRRVHPRASGRCSATPARTWSGRSPGSGC